MSLTMNDLTVNFSHLDRDDLLEEWHWLIGESKLPILLTSSGDAFLQDIDTGQVFFLDTASAELSEIANDTDRLRELLGDREFVTDYLCVNMVGELRSRGKALESGQIYSLTKPAVLGGEYEIENIEATDIEIHFSMLGQIHEKVRGLPDGADISTVTFS